MPILGLGTALVSFNLCTDHFYSGTFQARAGQVEPAIIAATTAGYRLIDTADVYENEEAIGGALQWIFNNGSIRRDEIFLTTKVLLPFLSDQSDGFSCHHHISRQTRSCRS